MSDKPMLAAIAVERCRQIADALRGRRDLSQEELADVVERAVRRNRKDTPNVG